MSGVLGDSESHGNPCPQWKRRSVFLLETGELQRVSTGLGLRRRLELSAFTLHHDDQQ